MPTTNSTASLAESKKRLLQRLDNLAAVFKSQANAMAKSAAATPASSSLSSAPSFPPHRGQGRRRGDSTRSRRPSYAHASSRGRGSASYRLNYASGYMAGGYGTYGGWHGAWYPRHVTPPARHYRGQSAWLSGRGRWGGRGWQLHRGGSVFGRGGRGGRGRAYGSSGPGVAAAKGTKNKDGARITSLVRLQGSLYAVSSDRRTLRRRSTEPAVKDRLAGQVAAVRHLKSTAAPAKRPTMHAFSRKRLASVAVAHSRRLSQRTRALKVRPAGKKKSCLFYNLFGKCDKMGKGCPYDHDTAKVAVCRRFLRGTCRADPCPLSHRVAPEKMPVCFHFLRGICGRDDCPYLHVKVGRDAPLCDDFRKGHCPAGAACSKRHEFKRDDKGGDQSGTAADADDKDADADGLPEGVDSEVDTDGIKVVMRPPASFVRMWNRRSDGTRTS
eukprot:m.47831 g.47831  ORF g.47831 m.47831 type:complete len:441 (-) comp6932_c0_seq1:446-1768(-)